MLEENGHHNQRGTGLGLSISKNIIEKMGGSVEVLSKVGKGSIFKVQLSSPYCSDDLIPYVAPLDRQKSVSNAPFFERTLLLSAEFPSLHNEYTTCI